MQIFVLALRASCMGLLEGNYCITCITMQNSTRECKAQEKQKITHMQNLASRFTKLYEVYQLFEFLLAVL